MSGSPRVSAFNVQNVSLLDIVATHVVPHLNVQDVQSLAHTCQRMRQLVNTAVPSASWTAVATHSCALGHPLRSCEPEMILTELRRLAFLNNTLTRGRMAASSEGTLPQSPDHELHALAVSPSSARIIAKHENCLVLSHLRRASSPPGDLVFEEQWRLPAPKPPQPWGLANIELLWSQDENFIVLKCTPFDGDVSNLQLVDMTRGNNAVWNTIYVLELATRSVLPISNTPDFTKWHKIMSLGDLLVSKDSRLVCAPWGNESENSELVQIHERKGRHAWHVKSQIELGQAKATSAQRFSPDSTLLALTSANYVAVYSTAGDLQASMPVVLATGGTLEQLEWSPGGDCIVCWCTNQPAMHIFDTASWELTAVAAFPSTARLARGLIYGLQDLIHVSWGEDMAVAEAISFCRLPTGGDPFNSHMDLMHFFFSHEAADVLANPRPLSQEVMPSLSPSGSFLAVVDRHMMLHIIKCATRAVVYQQQISLPPSTALKEESSGIASQVQWVRAGHSLQITTVIRDVDPPLSVQITLIDFVL